MPEKVKQIFYVVKTANCDNWVTTLDQGLAHRFADLISGWIDVVEKEINHEGTHFTEVCP